MGQYNLSIGQHDAGSVYRLPERTDAVPEDSSHLAVFLCMLMNGVLQVFADRHGSGFSGFGLDVLNEARAHLADAHLLCLSPACAG